MRKTIEVTEVLRMGNHFLANSPDEQKVERLATANFLESMLHAAGAYKGFQYLESAGVDHDRWNEAWNRHRAIVEIKQANGIATVIDTPQWMDYCKDDTRRAYIKAEGLQ